MRRILLCINSNNNNKSSSLSSPTHYLNMMRETKAVSPGLLGLYKVIHHRAIKSSFALKRTEVTNIRKTNAIRTSWALHFVFWGAIRPKRATLEDWAGCTGAATATARRVGIYRFTTLSGNVGIGAPKAPWLGKKSKLLLSIGVGTATFAASAYTNQALASPSRPVEVATSPSGQSDVRPFSLTEPKYDQSTFEGRLKSILLKIDPRNVLITDEELSDAQKLLEKFENGTLQEGEIDDAAAAQGWNRGLWFISRPGKRCLFGPNVRLRSLLTSVLQNAHPRNHWYRGCDVLAMGKSKLQRNE